MEERQELIVKILNEYDCCTALQVVGLAFRNYNETLTTYQVNAALRPLYAKGLVAKGANLKGTSVYWLTDHYKKELAEA